MGSIYSFFFSLQSQDIWKSLLDEKKNFAQVNILRQKSQNFSTEICDFLFFFQNRQFFKSRDFTTSWNFTSILSLNIKLSQCFNKKVNFFLSTKTCKWFYKKVVLFVQKKKKISHIFYFYDKISALENINDIYMKLSAVRQI